MKIKGLKESIPVSAAMMMEESDKSESSHFVIFKFAPELLRHVPQDSLLKLKPNIVYEISLGMRTVEDVINSLREEFAIPINILIIMEGTEALLIPRLSVKAFTYASNSFRIESSEAPRKAVSFVERARRAASSGIKIFAGWSSSSNEASEDRKRSAENPVHREMVPAKRQRSSSNDGTEDPTNSADRDAEETYGNVGGNAVEPKLDKIEPLTSPGSIMSQIDQEPSNGSSPQTSPSPSERGNKGSWSPAGYEDVKPHQIVQLKFKDEDKEGVDMMRVMDVGAYGILGIWDEDDSDSGNGLVCKSDILEIKILKVNGEAFYGQDDGGLWSPAVYEDVKLHQLIQLKGKDKEGPYRCIMNVTEVEEDGISGLCGETEVFEYKSEIEQVKVLTINGEAVYVNDV